MKTALIGAGKGCQAVIEMAEAGQLGTLDLEVLVVVDKNSAAPAMALARERGWPTSTSIGEALGLEGLELVLELTGRDDVLTQIYASLPPQRHIRVMDHAMARVFWDLEKVTLTLREQLREKTRLERRLAADRAELREILNTIPDVVMVVDQQMRVLRVNRRFEELTGRGAEEVEGEPYDAVFGPGATGGGGVDFRRSFEAVIDSRSPVSLIQYDEPAPADSSYFQISANPVFDEGGEIVRVVQTAQEITQQVMLKRETEEGARRFRQLVDTVHAVITIKDLEGRYRLVNPAAERLYGLKQAQMIGRRPDEVHSPEVAEAVQAAFCRAIENRGYHVAEQVLPLAGGERVLITERLPLTDYKGDMTGICCIARDDTDSRRQQQALLQAERLAAIGKLAAGVAHELNNPLTGILTFAEDLLEESAAGDPLREDYELILHEALRCRRIVRDLLDFARQKPPERQRSQIGPMVQRALTLVERQAAFHNISFDVAFAEGMPEVRIDAAQIQQVMINLVINARDAMDGSGTITVRGEASGDRQRVAVSVSDTGCGIPEELRAQIFEPFFSTKGDRGNGLGLPAVRSVIEQHRGWVEVRSVPGEGTTFRVKLPAATSSDTGEVETTKEERA